jgi:hypothetical protein
MQSLTESPWRNLHAHFPEVSEGAEFGGASPRPGEDKKAFGK